MFLKRFFSQEKEKKQEKEIIRFSKSSFKHFFVVENHFEKERFFWVWFWLWSDGYFLKRRYKHIHWSPLSNRTPWIWTGGRIWWAKYFALLPFFFFSFLLFLWPFDYFPKRWILWWLLQRMPSWEKLLSLPKAFHGPFRSLLRSWTESSSRFFEMLSRSLWWSLWRLSLFWKLSFLFQKISESLWWTLVWHKENSKRWFLFCNRCQTCQKRGLRIQKKQKEENRVWKMMQGEQYPSKNSKISSSQPFINDCGKLEETTNNKQQTTTLRKNLFQENRLFGVKIGE